MASNKSILVIGASPAGLSASKELANMGLNAILVEKEAYLGGTPKRLKYSLLFPELRPASEVLDPLTKAVEENGNIKIYTESIVENAKNVSDGFEVGIKDKKGNIKTEKVSSIIAAFWL